MRTTKCPTCSGSGSVPTATPEELREARLGAGLSQRKIASRLGELSTAYISDLERGNRNISPGLARRWMAICEAV